MIGLSSGQIHYQIIPRELPRVTRRDDFLQSALDIFWFVQRKLNFIDSTTNP